MSDHKLAADAIRSLASWKERALMAEAKVASFERRDKIAIITKKAESKGAVLPKDKDLTKCSEHELKDLERVLDLITPRGDIKLGGLEDEGAVTSGSPAKQRSELEDYLVSDHPEFR